MSLRKKYYNPENPRDAEELLNYLENLSSDDEDFEEIRKCDEIQLVLIPPEDGAESDQDDAASDSETLGTFRDIGKGVLKQPMDIICVSRDGDRHEVNLEETKADDSSDDDVPLGVRYRDIIANKKQVPQPLKKRNWTNKSLEPRPEKIKLDKSCEPDIAKKIRDENLQPVDLFKMFFDEEFVGFICEETKKYANLKGNHEFTVSNNELYIYFAILILSGYIRVPFRRMMWETKADSFNPLVSNSISRNRFDTIHRYIHFNDNLRLDPNNKIYKMQPFIDHINNVSQELFSPLGTTFSVDEAMEPYYGHHHMKQFIKGKPIRYGFKCWCLTTADGYLLKFSPYCGAGDKLEGKTLGASVTEKLCVGYLPTSSTVYIDNFFTSLTLLHTLKASNISCIGTIRSDRIEKAPLRDLKKCPRGSSHVLQDISNNITLARWNDNNQVTIATNVNDDNLCLTKGSCKRWSKKEKSVITVDQPTLINMYNQGMGGVDLFDKMRGLYRTRIRSRKWYWPFVRFCLNGAIVNMWLLYRYAHPKLSLLDFMRRIVQAILISPPHPTGPRPKCSRSVLHEVRYDRIDHLVEYQEAQRRCANCGKCVKFSCIKCNVGLHPKSCFRLYHMPPQ